MIRQLFAKFIKNTEELNYGRGIVVRWSTEKILNSKESFRILDLGLGVGTDIKNIRAKLDPRKVEYYGLETDSSYISHSRKIAKVFKIDIEHQKIPAANAYFDIVIANQIIEHTKEIFWIFSEISRVLKPKGIVIVGIPNLASFHNRILLLLGLQPSCIEILGPHVRGITKDGFKRFIETGKFYKVLKIAGSNFYPFPAPLAKLLARIFPNFSVGLFFLIERTNKKGSYISILEKNSFETPYFKG